MFLSGDEALKIKRAVKYDCLDFSTLKRRERMLRREVELNAPTAPQIYRDVVPVTRGPGGGLVLNSYLGVTHNVTGLATLPAPSRMRSERHRVPFICVAIWNARRRLGWARWRSSL